VGATSIQFIASVEDAPSGAMKHPDVHEIRTIGDNYIGVLARQLIGAHHRLGIPVSPKHAAFVYIQAKRMPKSIC